MKDLLDRLLKLNLEINSFLKSSDIELNETFKKLLDDKNVIISSLQKLKKLSQEEFSSLKNSEFKEAWEKIQKLEAENMNLIKDKKGELFEKIKGVKTQSKLISSYKYKKEQEPRLFDEEL